MIWIGLLIVYLIVGFASVAFYLGSCKVAGGWRPRQAWDQFTSEGLSGMTFWTFLAICWFPAILVMRGWSKR